MKYKWFFDESGVLTECAPKLDNDTKLEFAPESGEMFYRAKLTNALTFQIEFDDILSKGYSHTHVVVLHRFDDSENDFIEVWRGKFTLTDCTINYDRHTIEVTPATIDRYTDVIAALETDYNIVKLAPQMHPVNINIRPCLQIYKLGATRISNFIGGNGWDSDCEAGEQLQIEQSFVRKRDCIWFSIDYNSGPYAGKSTMYYGRFLMTGQNEYIFPIDGRIYNSDGTYIDDNTLECRLYQDLALHWVFLIRDIATQTLVVRTFYNLYDSGDNIFSIEWANNIDFVIFNWDIIYGRTICQTKEQSIIIGGVTYNLIDIPENDISRNRNYNKILPYAAAVIDADIDTSIDPTTWPQDIFGYYFEKPANTPTRHYFAVNPDGWMGVAYWFYAGAYAETIENTLVSQHQIKDCYDLRNTIAKLLQKAGWNGQYVISGVFGSQGYVGNNLLPIITPKSNVISSYYDTPAQNAPISLAKIFSMLKQAYKVYWHIDENNNLHLEHISYYQNGYSYTELPQQLVDLESDLHTRTKHSKAYGQNVVKFDKSGMPGVISFGWMDKQTVPFDGYDIKALDAYIEQGLKEENLVGDFSTDVDFVLSSPNDVSKDGFFLFALPKIGGSYSNTLKIEKINITDENGDNYDVTIQNADAAFCKIHKTFWRYNMPCENLQINNVPDTALTTGRFKTQTLEFADLSMADVIGDVDNCIKLIKTQQGYGAISKLSINLNSLSTTADLVFTLMGRKYYLKGAALNGTMTITLNGEQITINVSNNRFVYGYTEPINELKFAGTDVVSVDFSDTDTLDNLTATDDMFKNCTELIAVNFANKTFGAVITANDMFKGCVNLVDLICPDSSSWKVDLDFSDCPNLTSASLYDLIKFLYSYNAGVHTITPNTVMWNALDAAVQNDLIAKATAKGWTINIPAAYSILGTSGGNTVYVTINGVALELDSTGGTWQYAYNTPITSISFENDVDVVDIDFSNSDGLAGVTSLANTFKGCNGLTTVDFTNCDLTNVTNAADCFSGCGALYSVTIPSGTWKPDVDLSASNSLLYGEMLNFVSGLYTYTSGTHTITFNSTIWDAMSVADQQAVWNAADAKGWETNAVAIVYVIRGTSSIIRGAETFNIQFIDDGALSPSAAETITCATDDNGDWEYQYTGKTIYSLYQFARNNNTLITIDFSSAESINLGGARYAFQGCLNLRIADFSNLEFLLASSMEYMFQGCDNLNTILFGNAIFPLLDDAKYMFSGCTLLTTIDFSNATFASATTIEQMFSNCVALTNVSLPKATFENVTNASNFFGYGAAYDRAELVTLDLPEATFAKATNLWHFSYRCRKMTTLNMPKATFELVNGVNSSDGSVDWMRYCGFLTTINVPQNSTAIKPTSSPTYNPMYLADAPLSYASMLKVANWVSDLTGYTAHTCTFKATAWNALSSAEQTNIDTILSGKNWNRAIA